MNLDPPSLLPSQSTPPSPTIITDREWTVENDDIPELDLSAVWTEVMRVRPSMDNLDGKSSTHGSGESTDFQSLPEDDPLDESDDEEPINYDPATYGLSPDSLLRERFLVEAAKNGACIGSSFTDVFGS
jgi:hypothetical protein